MKNSPPYADESLENTVFASFKAALEYVFKLAERKRIVLVIMGTDGANSALFCECKWTNEKVDVGILDMLIERIRLFHYENMQFYLFPKSCVEKAGGTGNMTLVTFVEML